MRRAIQDRHVFPQGTLACERDILGPHSVWRGRREDTLAYFLFAASNSDLRVIDPRLAELEGGVASFQHPQFLPRSPSRLPSG